MTTAEMLENIADYVAEWTRVYITNLLIALGIGVICFLILYALLDGEQKSKKRRKRRERGNV